MPTLPICQAPECNSAAKNRSLCWAHYKRLRKYGSYDLPTVMDRVTESVTIDPDTGCWVWNKSLEHAIDALGYRSCRACSRIRTARHRARQKEQSLAYAS